MADQSFLDRIKILVPTIRQTSKAYGLNPDLVAAIIWQESSGDTYAVRFESKSSIVYMPSVFAKKLNISHETEVCLQHISFGLGQVMGFKARELGFDGHLFQICQYPETGLDLLCKALSGFKKRFVYEEDFIAAYNAGSPIRGKDGKYINHDYVESVKFKWAKLEKVSLFV